MQSQGHQACLFPAVVAQDQRATEWSLNMEVLRSQKIVILTESFQQPKGWTPHRKFYEILGWRKFYHSAIVYLPRVRTPIDSHSSAQTTSCTKCPISIDIIFQVERTCSFGEVMNLQKGSEHLCQRN